MSIKSSKDDLDALMRAHGFSRDGQAPAPGVTVPAPKKAPPAPSTKQLAALHKSLGAAARPTKPKKKTSTVSIPPVDPDARLVGATRRQEQLAVLLGEVDALAARTLEAEAQAKDLRKREQNAKLKAEEATGKLKGVRSELQAAQAHISTLEAQLKSHSQLSTGARAAQSAAQAELHALRTQTAPSPTLRQLLRARGLADETELWEALLLLADQAPDVLLSGLRAVHDSPLPQALRERIVLVGPEQTASPDSLAISVSAERCELGETGLRTRYSEVVQAAELAGVTQLCLVGGSVAYRKQLKHLADGHALKLRLISGTARRLKRQADADLRTCDVAVLWGGSELDHAVSELYRGEHVWGINHRGLSGMLAEVGARLLEQAG
ncbi:MAG: hypothetical protein ACI9VR_005147 [Cognaticolwellia sp.]|jgi:hypothetical protein